MKKPRKPRTPMKVMFFAGYPSGSLQAPAYVKADELPQEIMHLTTATSSIPKKHLSVEHCYVRCGYAYYDLTSLPEAIVKKYLPNREFEKVQEYHKKMVEHKRLMRKYKINMKLYEAWKLKAQKDELLTKAKKFEVALQEVQEKIDKLNNNVKELTKDE